MFSLNPQITSRDASISGLQASKADASALTAYALPWTLPRRWTHSKIAAALLDGGPGRRPPRQGALLSTVDGLDTPLEVDTKIANARPSSQRSLLAGTPASRRSRGPRPTRRCWPHQALVRSHSARRGRHRRREGKRGDGAKSGCRRQKTLYKSTLVSTLVVAK